MPNTDNLIQIVREVCEEISRARTLFPPFRSAHEGYAVLLEEVDELWQQVKFRQSRERDVAMRKEAIQVAAMAICFIHESCPEDAKP